MRVVVVIAIVVATGCGRLHFEDRTAGGGDDGAGDGGTLPLVCAAPAPEVCNGIDDDCNGLVDEGCPCTPLSTTFTESPGYYTQTAIWTGDHLIQVGIDSATIGLYPVDASGAVQPFVPLFGGAAGTAADVAAAWNGSVLGLAFSHDLDVLEAGRYDPASGQVVKMTIDTTYPGANPHVAWAGDHFVVAWQTTTDDVIVRDLATSGAPLGPERVLVPATGGILGAIRVSPAGTLACVRDRMDGTARAIAIDATGAAHTQPIPIGIGMFCELLPIAGGYLAYYHQPSTAPVPLAFLDASGNVTATASLPATAYDDVEIERAPSGFWVLASSTPALYSHAVDDIELDSHGTAIAAPVQQDLLSAYLWSPPRLVATTGRRISAWSQNAGGAPSMYRLTRTCP